jgi:hypothetical protein
MSATDTQVLNAMLLERLLERSSLTPMTVPEFVKLHAEGFTPLSIDRLDSHAKGVVLALAHNSIQNGDVMADPDVAMTYHAALAGDAVSYLVAHHYQNSYAGVYREPRTEAQQRDLDAFVTMWLRNLWSQGHVVKAEGEAT